ncbi:NAD-dependent epimerase/dehydratase family protein [Methanococcoides burtonii]|uniref:NAD-dependent sugar epimerase n=1 Tax=Methanococcoides burtonii (strain DSM 6242 / NBRC 107633 / OCM 468 / ACE-M) TaxID=259564 RepID=Q12UG3_METBU|nr:NAD-dependent epimerase/dehydratase family protein [Methanococcoides burtonii]ABE52913.1 NAD-dependent sugar epimerase [Methanococcoides burtonii DSM 6242]
MKRILITGGAGQVGSYLVDRFHEENEVTILDNYSSPTRKDVPEGVSVIKADIRDDISEHMSNTDVIIHTAAQISVVRSMNEPFFDAQNNIMGTLNLLEEARHANIERFVYFSSAATYGNPLKVPIGETHPQEPLSPYGASKLAGEKYCIMYNKAYGLPTTCIRPFNIYSPRQDPSNPYSGVISKFIDKVSGGASPTIFGDGEQTRDFIYVRDIVDLVDLMISKRTAIGESFNAATGRSTTINELAEIIIDLFGKELKADYKDPLEGDIKHSVADISKAEKLGFVPKVDLRKGLETFLEK